MLNITKQFIPLTRKLQRSGLKMNPSYITIHSTGNPRSTAKNEADNVCYNSTRQASFHFVVDDTNIYYVLPIDEVGWHAGDGKKGTGNRKSIGIEICESGDRRQALLNAMKLVWHLMSECNIPIENIRQHHDWMNKDCPRILRNNEFIKGNMSWQWFMDTLRKGDEEEMEQVYKTFDEVPNAYRDKVIEYMNAGIIMGDEKGNINLTVSMIRNLMFTERMIKKYA